MSDENTKLSLDLSPNELDALKRSVEKLLKDAVYHGKFLDERYAKALMTKISEAELEKQRYNEILNGLNDLGNFQFDDFEIDDEEEII